MALGKGVVATNDGNRAARGDETERLLPTSAQSTSASARPMPTLPILFFYITMICTVSVTTLHPDKEGHALSKTMIHAASISQASINFIFLVMTVALLRAEYQGASRWQTMKRQQFPPRNAILQMTIIAYLLLITVDILLVVWEEGTIETITRLCMDLFGYPALFLTWWCPPSRPKLSALSHFIFALTVMGYSFYELEVRTNDTRKFNELYTRRAMTQLLMIFELAHVVVGAKYLKFHDVR